MAAEAVVVEALTAAEARQETGQEETGAGVPVNSQAREHQREGQRKDGRKEEKKKAVIFRE